jgi:quinol monooxygenase YgiN
MPIKIIIKRTVPKSKARELVPLFNQIRHLAEKQPGHITSITLKSLDKPDTFLVISDWASTIAWAKWLENKAVKEIRDKIDSLLGEKTKFETYWV